MDRLFDISVAVPAGTPISAPVIQSWPLDEATLKRIEITIPDGHNGLTGIRILWAGQQIIPWSNNQYLVGSGRTIPVEFNQDITISGLVIEAYNTDVYSHSFYLLATVVDLTASQMSSTMTGSGAVALPALAAIAPDPLSPAALLASLPDSLGSVEIPGEMGLSA